MGRPANIRPCCQWSISLPTAAEVTWRINCQLQAQDECQLIHIHAYSYPLLDDKPEGRGHGACHLRGYRALYACQGEMEKHKERTEERRRLHQSTEKFRSIAKPCSCCIWPCIGPPPCGMPPPSDATRMQRSALFPANATPSIFNRV